MNTPIGEILNVKYHEEMVAVDSFVQLKVMIFEPSITSSLAPILFVSGWVSAISGWSQLIKVMALKRRVYYVETREKKSALIATKTMSDDDFSIGRNVDDLIKVCTHFGIDDGNAIAMGSSFGATICLEAMKNNKLKVGGAFLVGPNSEFRAPKFLRWILYLPSCFFYPLKYVVIWYLRTFRVNAKNEPEQMKRYEETIKVAEPDRLKLSARSVILGHYQIWEDLKTIKVPVAIAYAVSDKLHSHDNILRMIKDLPNGIEVACPTNLYMHSSDLLDDIEVFERNIIIATMSKNKMSF